MKLPVHGHLTYCSNIHPGESWGEVFQSLRRHLPTIKKKVSPDQPLGIGLRLSNQASQELIDVGTETFLHWMRDGGFYVFTMNGFPYGGFHGQRVKDEVHRPDWTTNDRVDYTLRLFDLLARLLPENIDGGISTSPLSYKPWWRGEQTEYVFREATKNIIKVVKQLHYYHQDKGILMHLDIEPEPDGTVENSGETIRFFQDWLLPSAEKELTVSGVSAAQAREMILRHVRVCYDVCHFAVAYETPVSVIKSFADAGIQIGKIQISSALKSEFGHREKQRKACAEMFQSLDEPTYLHQVIARDRDNNLHQYRDLPLALENINDPAIREWRTHFHVPVFVESYGLLQSTQSDIREVLNLWQAAPMTNHLEVETYTWEVLPGKLQTEITASIARELDWVVKELG